MSQLWRRTTDNGRRNVKIELFWNRIRKKRFPHPSSWHWVCSRQISNEWYSLKSDRRPWLSSVECCLTRFQRKAAISAPGGPTIQIKKSPWTLKPQTFWEEKIFVSYFTNSSLEGPTPHFDQTYFRTPVYWRKYTCWAILRTECDIVFTILAALYMVRSFWCYL